MSRQRGDLLSSWFGAHERSFVDVARERSHLAGPDAEDVAQEALLRAAIDDEHRFPTLEDALRWFGTTTWRMGNDARKARRREPVVACADVPDMRHASVPGPETAVMGHHDRAAIASVVQALRTHDALALATTVAGLPNREAAAFLGMNEAAYKSRVHRLRVRLRRALREHGIAVAVTSVFGSSVTATARRTAARSVLAAPPVVAVGVVIVALRLAIPQLDLAGPGRGVAPPRPAAPVAHDDAFARRGGAGPAGPAVPRPAIAAPSRLASPSAGSVRPARKAMPLGWVPRAAGCVPGRGECEGDHIYVVTPRLIAERTGPTPLDGTSVSDDKVPLCWVPNTVATRCETRSRPR